MFDPQCVPDPTLRSIGCPDLAEHGGYRLVCSAVEWTFERADRRGNRRMQVGHRRSGDSGGEGGGIEFMFRIQNQRDVQQVPHGLSDLILLASREQPEESV